MTYKLIEHSIEDIADIIGGGTPSSKVEEYYGGNIPWITPKDLSGYNDVYISKGSRNITELGLSKSSAKMLPENAVLFTSRAPIGYVAIAESQVCTNQGFKSLIPKADLLDYKFAYYLMKYYAPQIEASASGTTFKEISGGALKTFKVKIPESTETQRNIADILFKLDSKISNNTAMNATLEKIAQRIFKSCFVDFDPVKANAEGVPFDGLSPEIQSLFPNEFEESELGMIPKGWEVKSLDNIVNCNPRRTIAKGELATFVEMKALSTTGMSIDYSFLREFTSGTKFINGDTLLARITPCLENGKTAYVQGIDGIAWGSTEFIVMNSKNDRTKEFIYCLSRTDEFRNYAIKNMEGTSGRQRVSAKAVQSFQIPIPSDESLEIFSKTVRPLFEKVYLNTRNTETLSKIRDKLLPRLISGKITIQKAEELLEEAS